MKEVSIALSRRMVEFLQKEKGMDLKEIARLAGTTPKFVSEVAAGQKPFKQSHVDKIQAETDIFPAMAAGLVSELIASKTKEGRKFVVEKSRQGQKLLKKSTGAVIQLICSMAAEHAEKKK